MSELGNPLAPQGGQAPGPMAPPDAHAPLQQTVQDAHQQAAAKVGKIRQAQQMVGKMLGTMDGLSKLGDLVTPEDVMKGAGEIVGHGGDPMQIAGLLADMPQGGEAIAQWLSGNVEKLQGAKANLDQAMAGAQHEAGVAALHSIAMHHIGQAYGAGAPPAAPAVEGPEASEGLGNALRPD